MGDIVKMQAKAVPTPVLEVRIIGALLDLGVEKTTIIASGLNDDDWQDPRCRTAWGVIKRMAEFGRAISAIAVFSLGQTVHAFGNDDLPWLESAANQNTVSREQLPAVIEDLRRTVTQRTVAKQLLQLSAGVASGKAQDAQVFSDLQGVRDRLTEPSEQETAATDVIEVMDRWAEREASGKTSLRSTGIKLLDEAVGGLPPSLTMMIARPGGGKTGTISSMIRAQLQADPDLNIGLFGLEDGTDWLARRWIALETDMLLRDVGRKSRRDDEKEALQVVAAAIFELAKRVHVYRRDRIDPRELLRRAAAMIRHRKIGALYIDNLSEVDVRKSGDWLEAQGELSYGLRRLANDTGVPVVTLAHINEERTNTPGPPSASSVRGGRSNDQRARLMLGLWPKGDAWRCTVLKANESESGQTIEFERIPKAAMIAVDGGRFINLAQERREEREIKNKDRDAERARARAEREAAKAAAAAVKKATAETQASLDLGKKPRDD